MDASFSLFSRLFSHTWLNSNKNLLLTVAGKTCFLANLQLFLVQIQKEVISDLMRENQFLSKEIWESTYTRILVLKLDFTAHCTMESLSECGLLSIYSFTQRRHLISSIMQEGHGHTLAIHLNLAGVGHCFGPRVLQLGELHAEPTAVPLFTFFSKDDIYTVHDAGKTWPYPGDPSSPRCRCGALFRAMRPPTGETTRWTNSCPPIYVF